MDLHLDGKTALVTGSTKGIGLAIAKRLKEEGCNVIINSRNQVDIDKLVKEYGFSGIKADVTSQSDANILINKSIKEFGKIDIVVCNVGSGRSVSPSEETYEEWQRVFNLNLFSTTNTVKSAYEEIRKNKGTIVCVSSICGVAALGAPITYSSAKSALNAYVKGIARPLGQSGARINAVALGNILFDGSVWELKLKEDKDDVYDMLGKEVALNKLGSTDEVADIVSYLASERSSFITGSIIIADGGQIR